MIVPFLVVDGLLFWAVAAVITLMIVGLLANNDEHGTTAVFVAMVALILTVLFTDAFAGASLVWLAVGVVVYCVCGVVWSFKKWWDYVVTSRGYTLERYNTQKQTETWEVYSTKQMPTAAGHKAEIVSWMALWPFSFTWWVLTWPRKFFSWAYTKLSTVFDRLTAKAFSKPIV